MSRQKSLSEYFGTITTTTATMAPQTCSKTCEQCGVVFKPDRLHPHQRFCSDKCSQKHGAKRRGKEYRSKYMKKWYLSNKDTVRAYHNKFRSKTKAKMFAAGTKACECGCGQVIPTLTVTGKNRRFVAGHRITKRLSPEELISLKKTQEANNNKKTCSNCKSIETKFSLIKRKNGSIYKKYKWRQDDKGGYVCINCHYELHKDRYREKHKDWRNRNKIKRSQYMKQWSKDNKERLTEYMRKWRIDNHERRVRLDSEYYFSKRLELFQILADDGVHVRCAQCSFDTDILALQVDHIDNTGYIDRKRFNGVTKTMCLYYIAHPEEVKKNLQILCANCNQLKRINSKLYDKDRLQLIQKILSSSNDQPHCVYCGYNTSIHALQLDHIKGGGLADIRRFSNSHKFYRYYVLHPEEAKEKLQLLCVNCNRIKGMKKLEQANVIQHQANKDFFTLSQTITLVSVT